MSRPRPDLSRSSRRRLDRRAEHVTTSYHLDRLSEATGVAIESIVIRAIKTDETLRRLLVAVDEVAHADRRSTLKTDDLNTDLVTVQRDLIDMIERRSKEVTADTIVSLLSDPEIPLDRVDLHRADVDAHDELLDDRPSGERARPHSCEPFAPADPFGAADCVDDLLDGWSTDGEEDDR